MHGDQISICDVLAVVGRCPCCGHRLTAHQAVGYRQCWYGSCCAIVHFVRSGDACRQAFCRDGCRYRLAIGEAVVAGKAICAISKRDAVHGDQIGACDILAVEGRSAGSGHRLTAHQTVRYRQRWCGSYCAIVYFVGSFYSCRQLSGSYIGVCRLASSKKIVAGKAAIYTICKRCAVHCYKLGIQNVLAVEDRCAGCGHRFSAHQAALYRQCWRSSCCAIIHFAQSGDACRQHFWRDVSISACCCVIGIITNISTSKSNSDFHIFRQCSILVTEIGCIRIGKKVVCNTIIRKINCSCLLSIVGLINACC